jgi:hypothetical protein
VRKHQSVVAFAAISVLLFGSARVLAQDPPPPPSQPPQPGAKAPLIPLQVRVVVSRYQGEKKVASLPYEVSVSANVGGQAAQLRMGADVPVPNTTFLPGPPQPPTPTPTPTEKPAPPKPPAPPFTSFNYKAIGTNIDCSAFTTEDGRFRVHLSIEDSSVYTEVQDASLPIAGKVPVFRSFRSSNTLVLRDGQSRQFTAATDRISGEVVRVDVTLTVLK